MGAVFDKDKTHTKKDGAGGTAKILAFKDHRSDIDSGGTPYVQCINELERFINAFYKKASDNANISLYILNKIRGIIEDSPMKDMDFTEDRNGLNSLLSHIPTYAPTMYPLMNAADGDYIYTAGVVVYTDERREHNIYEPVVVRSNTIDDSAESWEDKEWHYLPGAFDGYDDDIKNAALHENAEGRITRGMIDSGGSEDEIKGFLNKNRAVIDIAIKAGDVCGTVIIGGEVYLVPRNPHMGGCGIRHKDGVFEVCQLFHNEQYLSVFASEGGAMKPVMNMVFPVGTLQTEKDVLDFIGENFDRYSPSGMWVIPLSEKTVLLYRTAGCSADILRAVLEKKKLNGNEREAFDNVVTCFEESLKEND